MSNTQNDKIKYYYNENQAFYDVFWMNRRNLAMHYGYWEKGTEKRSDALINENEYVIKALDVDSEDLVLDAGCGVGGTAIYIAEKYGAKVVGIGLVEKQNRAAKSNAISRKVNDLVDFKVADYNSTGFPDGHFTRIYAIESACHAENKEDFIREAYRLLKPGGRLVVCDYFVIKLSTDKDESDYQTFCAGWAMANLTRRDAYKDMLRNNNFINIKFNDHTKLAMKSSLFMHRLAKAWLPIDKTMNLIGLVSDENLTSTKASISQYSLFNNGSLVHGIFSADKPAVDKAKSQSTA